MPNPASRQRQTLPGGSILARNMGSRAKDGPYRCVASERGSAKRCNTKATDYHAGEFPDEKSLVASSAVLHLPPEKRREKPEGQAAAAPRGRRRRASP